MICTRCHLIINSLARSSVLASKAPGPLVLQQRHVRGVTRIFRKKLPQYRNSLYDLPPLTEQLTHHRDIGQEIQNHDTEKLLDKLNTLRRIKLDTYKRFLPDNQKPLLLEAMFNTDNDIDRLLRIIGENIDTMTSFYVAVAFETLDDSMRYKQCDVATIMVAPEFKLLCSKALLKVRFFEADETLKLIKCLSSIGLPEDSLLSQAAFQMARHQINEFNMDELDTLSDCLESFRICDSSKKSLLLALREAIPVAKRNQIDEKLFTRLAAGQALESGRPEDKQEGVN